MNAAAPTEHAVVFTCEGDPMVGIVHRPADEASSTGVVVIVGGPQYRAGSHRQFVLLARRLAGAGYPVLRFDHRGMGDSGGVWQGFERVSSDISAAIDALRRADSSIERVVLWGLCDAASSALLYCGERSDPRVAGLVLANPWVRSEAGLARTHLKHHYRHRLMEREFWRKLMTGGIGMTAARDLVRNVALWRRATTASNLERAPFQDRMAAAWRGFCGPVLLLMSDDDYTAREFQDYVTTVPAWAGALDQHNVERMTLTDADHTFSQHAAQLAAQTYTVQWLARRRLGPKITLPRPAAMAQGTPC